MNVVASVDFGIYCMHTCSLAPLPVGVCMLGYSGGWLCQRREILLFGIRSIDVPTTIKIILAIADVPGICGVGSGNTNGCVE